MSAGKNDGIGFAAWRRRSTDVKDVNNATRELFRQAVMDLFGAKTINDVPKSVRDKMKLTDYDGHGHPLSAHRIRSVANSHRGSCPGARGCCPQGWEESGRPHEP